MVVVDTYVQGGFGGRPTSRRGRVLGSLACPPTWVPVGRGWPLDSGASGTLRHCSARPPGDLLLVDEAGMMDQDTALALLAITDENRRPGSAGR